jgi:hypothetical protein
MEQATHLASDVFDDAPTKERLKLPSSDDSPALEASTHGSKPGESKPAPDRQSQA